MEMSLVMAIYFFGGGGGRIVNNASHLLTFLGISYFHITSVIFSFLLN